MSIMVTGGTGFIGARIVRRLVERGEEVVCFDLAPPRANAELTRPFWEAAKRHELVMPRCNTCSNIFFYPRECCPNCLASSFEWVPVSGKGRVYSYTVVYQPVNPAFQVDIPYIYAIIQLDEGPRMASNLVDCPIEEAEVDMPVTVVFDEATPEVTLIKFRPA